MIKLSIRLESSKLLRKLLKLSGISTKKIKLSKHYNSSIVLNIWWTITVHVNTGIYRVYLSENIFK